MRVAIIGAGWAGAACAWQLHQYGHQVTVFDSSRIAGGRARRAQAAWGTVDNGQHLLLGAYHSTLGLMQQLGLPLEQCFYRLDLDFYSLDERFRFRYWPLPAPWHQLGVLLGGRGVSWGQRLGLLRLLHYLKKQHWQPPIGQTVAQLLQATQQSPQIIARLWQPLCIAALNTPIDVACAGIFAAVLRDSLGQGRDSTQMLIPLKDMSTLWVERALAPVSCQLGTTVQRIEYLNDYRHHYRHPTATSKAHQETLRLHTSHGTTAEFDACVIATQIPSALRLLQPLAQQPTQKQLLQDLGAIEFNPIATLYLQPDEPWAHPRPMHMLFDDPHSLEAGQWLFNHAALPHSFARPTLSVVISDAQRLKGKDKKAISQAIIKQIKTQLPAHQPPLPPLRDSLLITEQRATFLATPHIKRPKATSPWPNVYFAADWVQSDYPAVLEAAVRSGQHTAQLLHQALGPAT